MREPNPTATSLPLKMVGGSVFGRYPMISVEQTWNMIISDGWLVPYAGYRVVADILPTGEGRGIYASNKLGSMILVVNDGVYVVSSSFADSKIGTIETYTGEVYIAENNNNEIAICDGKNIYIFNYSTNAFSTAVLSFIPGYIDFQDGYFIAAVTGAAEWQLSALNDGLTWPSSANTVGGLQSKPTTCVAVVRIPGQGGSVFVFGETVTEQWYDTGSQLFPYQRNNFFNLDYGCLSAATIATLEDLVIWLASSEKAGPIIMYTNGGKPQKLSTDGIDFKLAQLTAPNDSYGFLFRQDGHMIYQITFVTDNLSLAFDFNTMSFLNTCDENMNFHIAKRVVFFNNKYFFVSFSDGNLYEINSEITTFNGAEIPRIRICPTIRLPNQSQFITNNLNFPIEQGVNEGVSRVDMSISIDGGYQFGNFDDMQMQAIGSRLNKFVYWNLGWSNELTPQFRMWGTGRFVVGNGTVNIYV